MFRPNWPFSNVQINFVLQAIIFCFVKKPLVLRRMASSGMLRRVAVLSTDVSEELTASIIGVTRIGELGT
jgi:hypothetical protein